MPGGTTASAVAQGSSGTVQLPAVQAGGGILIRNDGIYPASLFYADAEPAGVASWAAMARNGGAGTVQIPAGGFRILTDTTAGPIATYTGGPLAIFAGTFQYAVLAGTPDHPRAAVKI